MQGPPPEPPPAPTRSPSNTAQPPTATAPAPPPAVPGKYNGGAFLEMDNFKLEGIAATFVPISQQQGAITLTNGQRNEDSFFDLFWEERTVRAGTSTSASSASRFQVEVQLEPGPPDKTEADAWIERFGWVQAGDQGGALTISVPYELSLSELLQAPDFHTFSSVQLLFGDQTVHWVSTEPGIQRGILTATQTLAAGQRVEFNLRTQAHAEIVQELPAGEP